MRLKEFFACCKEWFNCQGGCNLKILYPIRMAILLVPMAFLMTGCFGASSVSYGELRKASLAHHGDTYPDTTYYCGTKEGCDYYYVKYGASGFNQGKKYRIATEESPQINRFEYTSDEDHWKQVTLYMSMPPRRTN